jgi:hypothetical protein
MWIWLPPVGWLGHNCAAEWFTVNWRWYYRRWSEIEVYATTAVTTTNNKLSIDYVVR